MTTTLAGDPAVAPDLAGLSYHSTVDRRLLHRSALSEVFLTDCRRIDEHHYAAAAQLPPLHAYYTDTTVSALCGGSPSHSSAFSSESPTIRPADMASRANT